MKRILTIAFIAISVLSISAQNLPGLPGEYVPYHTFLTNHRPVVYGVKSDPANQLKEYSWYFVIGDDHYIYNNTPPNQGWGLSDSSTFTYTDSSEYPFLYLLAASFPIADTTIGYNASNQTWALDSEFTAVVNGANATDSFVQLSRTGQVYNPGPGTWTNTFNYIYTYTADNSVNSLTYQTWNSTKWVDIDSINYSYNGNGILDTESIFTGAPLLPDTQYVYAYNSLGQDSQEFVRVGNGSGGWTNSLQYIYQYTPINNLFTGITVNSWDGSVYSSYGTYSYSRNNNTATYLLQVNSVNTYQEDFTYDYRNNLVSYENYSFSNNTPTPLVQYLYNYDIDNNTTFEQDSYWSSGAYVGIDQYYYYYKYQTVLNINNISDTLSAYIYPNPSTGQVNISLNVEASSSLVVTVYDATGNKVSGMNTQIKEGNNILPLQLSQLAAGNYLIHLTDANSGKSSTLNWVKQ